MDYNEFNKQLYDFARAPLIDKLEKCLQEKNEMREALEHAINWGHGFEGTGSRPEWLTEAEKALGA